MDLSRISQQRRQQDAANSGIYGRSLPEERLLRQQFEEEQRQRQEQLQQHQQQQQFQQQQQSGGLYSTTTSSSSNFRDQFRLSDSQNRLYSDGNLRGSLMGVSGSSTLSRIPSSSSRPSQSRPPSRLAVESPLHQEQQQQQKPAATFLPPELAKLRAGHLGMAAKAQSTDRLFQHGE